MAGLEAIAVRELGKRYRLGEDFARYATLRDALAGEARPPKWQRPRARETSGRCATCPSTSPEGETLGVDRAQRRRARARCSSCSRGSPSRPRAAHACAGASGALLEVGTGFHPELTGRENVFLNGVDPRDVAAARSPRGSTRSSSSPASSAFLDTPLKRYSSGMELRLAFAVAAHVEPPILDRRRGARRRRRGVPAALPGEDVRDRAQRADDRVREPRPRGGAAALLTDDLARRGTRPGRWTVGRRHHRVPAIGAGRCDARGVRPGRRRTGLVGLGLGARRGGCGRSTLCGAATRSPCGCA